MNERETLESMLGEAGVDRTLAQRLAAYGALVLEANRRFNLSGAGAPEELLPHLLDSLTLVPYVRGPMVDVGSGGGLPAIPLALACGTAVTLVESTAKKAAFLDGALESLRLHGKVVPERAEIAGRSPDLREQFETATARAVSTASTVLELTAPFLRVGGDALLQRGRLSDAERNAVMDAAPMLGLAFSREVSLDGDRRILVFHKTEPTPQRFPRRVGVPEKRPLCLPAR